MTDKICKKCGNYQDMGHFCTFCGTQLYPDIGFTEWKIPRTITWREVNFNKWSGKHA